MARQGWERAAIVAGLGVLMAVGCAAASRPFSAQGGEMGSLGSSSLDRRVEGAVQRATEAWNQSIQARQDVARLRKDWDQWREEELPRLRGEAQMNGLQAMQLVRGVEDKVAGLERKIAQLDKGMARESALQEHLGKRVEALERTIHNLEPVRAEAQRGAAIERLANEGQARQAALARLEQELVALRREMDAALRGIRADLDALAAGRSAAR